MSFLGYDPNEDLINQISGTSTPQYQQADLDAGTKGLIQDSVTSAQQPYKSSNIDQSASMFMPKGPTQGQANTGLLSAPGAGQAIANKYSQIAGEQLSGLKSQQGRTDAEQQFSKTGMAFNNAMVQQQVQMQNYQTYLQQIKNENEVRAQTLNTILGGAATIGGAALGAGGGGSRGRKSGGGGGGASLGPSSDYLGESGSINSLGGGY